MTIEMWLLIAVMIAALTPSLLGRWKTDVAGLFIIMALGLAQFAGLGMLGAPNSPEQSTLALSGLAQPLTFILLGLFILTRALTDSGVMLWLGTRLAAAARRSVSRLVLLFALSAAALSLLMNNVAVGALLLPGALQASRKNHIRPGRLLIPIAFGTALGGMATYFTTANIVMSHVLTMSDPPQAALNILSFAPVGGLVAAAGIAYLTIYGYRMVPARRPAPEQLLARRTSDELEGLFEVGERLWEARIDEISPLIGRSLQASSLGEKLGIAVCALRRGYQAYFAPRSEEIIRAHDVLLIVGREDRVMQLGSLGALVKPQTHSITNFGLTLIELILAPHSAYVGRTIKELDFRRRFGFTVLAIQRGARSHRTDVGTIALQRGDALLIAGLASGARSLQADPEVIVFEADPASRPVSRGRAALSISIFVGAVVLSLLGLPIFLAVLTAALLAVLGGFVALRDAYRSIEWEILIFLAGMYAASLAMVNTGLAAFMSRAVLDSLGGVSAIGLAAAAFLVAASLTQVMGGQATAFIVGPIAVSSAIELHVNPQAIAVAAAIGCGAAFLTPLAHPVNLIMMGPGNYRFGDFARSGAALMLVVFVALLAGLAWFWGL